MNYEKWAPVYFEIMKDLKFDIDLDEKAAVVLNTLLRGKKHVLSSDDLRKIIQGREIVVFGAGPSLEKTFQQNQVLWENIVTIAADGATTALIENNIWPTVIVSDLDGNVDDQIHANKKNSIMVVHAHGDNIESLRRYVPRFRGKIVGTTQTDPSFFDQLYNFGGFTDGDRAVFLADHFQAKEIYLAGFDFGNEIGRYSFTEKKNLVLKAKKLRWCQRLIQLIDNPHIHFI